MISVLSLLVLLLLSTTAAASPLINSPAAIVMDANSGQVLLAKNIHEQRPPASLTKILTTLIAIEQGNSSDMVTVSNSAARMGGASIGLRSGETVSLDALVTATFFRSGNDGAIAVAEHLSGSSDSFASVMNAKARSIGLTNSSFRNPHGLDEPNHYSTAFDLAVLTRVALMNPIFAELARTNYTRIRWGGAIRDFWNINSFLWRFDGSNGVKTGYTSQAGYCLAASATRDGVTLILVLLGAQTSNQRWNEAIRVLSYAFQNYPKLTDNQTNDEQTMYQVQNGDTLWDIARLHNVSIQDIVQANALSNPDSIRRGQVLTIPEV